MYEYLGAETKAYVPGVPARDLTNEEWRDLPSHLTDRATSLGLYRRVKNPEPTPAEEPEPTALAINQADPEQVRRPSTEPVGGRATVTPVKPAAVEPAPTRQEPEAKSKSEGGSK